MCGQPWKLEGHRSLSRCRGRVAGLPGSEVGQLQGQAG